MNEKAKEVFIIRTLNEEQTDVIITVGNHLATEKHFKNKEEAERYMKLPKWDMVIALISEIVNNIKKIEDGKN